MMCIFSIVMYEYIFKVELCSLLLFSLSEVKSIHYYQITALPPPSFPIAYNPLHTLPPPSSPPDPCYVPIGHKHLLSGSQQRYGH